jgi:hypothetical protein
MKRENIDRLRIICCGLTFKAEKNSLKQNQKARRYREKNKETDNLKGSSHRQEEDTDRRTNRQTDRETYRLIRDKKKDKKVQTKAHHHL